MPEIGDGGTLVIKMRFTEEGICNPLVVLEESYHYIQILGQAWGNNWPVIDAVMWAELSWNAKAGNAEARLALLQIEMDMVEYIANRFLASPFIRGMEDTLGDYLKARKVHLEKMLAEATSMVKQKEKEKQAQQEKEESVENDGQLKRALELLKGWDVFKQLVQKKIDLYDPILYEHMPCDVPRLYVNLPRQVFQMLQIHLQSLSHSHTIFSLQQNEEAIHLQVLLPMPLMFLILSF